MAKAKPVEKKPFTNLAREKIKELVKQKNLKLGELATATGLKGSTLSGFLNSDNGVTFETIYVIVKKLGKSMTWLEKAIEAK